MRRSPLTRDDFPESRLLAGFEGGAVYTAERDGKFYIIQDESTMADFLSEEDLRDLADSLVKVLEFDTAAEREAYIRERGWAARAESQRRRRGTQADIGRHAAHLHMQQAGVGPRFLATVCPTPSSRSSAHHWIASSMP